MQTEENVKKLNDLKLDISTIKAELNKANKEKEAYYQKKQDISAKILNLIGEAKKSKSQRNEYTKEVRLSKEERNKINTEIKDKIEAIKKLNKQKKDIMKKHNIQEDFVKLKKEKEILDKKIETEVMSFNKEQQLMKSIREIDQKLANYKIISSVWEKIHALSKEIDTLKKKAEATHKKIQNKATESQKKHELMIENSTTIDDLRKKEKEAMKQFKESKEKYKEINIRLKNKLQELNGINKDLDIINKKDKRNKEAADKKTLEEKEAAVKEKMKKGKKLTTEDLLVFQKMNK